MKYFIIKIKDRDLFFNADEMMGEYACNTPMLLDKEQVDSIMKYCHELYLMDGDEVFYNHHLEVKEVELKYV